MRHSLLFLLFSILSSAFAGNDKIITSEIKSQAEQWMNAQSVNFLENKGQMTDEKGNPTAYVLFKATLPGMNMYVTKKGLTYGFMKITEEGEEESVKEEKIKERDEFKAEYCRIDMELKNANIKMENIISEEPVEWVSNYYLGHCPDGIQNVHAYKKVIITDIYPGIDWILYHTNEKGLKYDFIVHPGANPNKIELIYSSLKPLIINREGAIEIATEFGILKEQAPISYQNDKEIVTQFVKTVDRSNTNGGYDTRVQFAIPNYNTTQILTIDPQLIWSTYFITGTNNPGSAVGPLDIEVDAWGNVFVVGYTFVAPAFPTLNAGGTTYYQGTFAGGTEDGIITKFNSSGALLWSTFYGGSVGYINGFPINGVVDEFYGLDIDAAGNIYITGVTSSSDFPVQNPLGTAFFQGVNVQVANGLSDACILKFNNGGTRIWSTFFGGNGEETAYDIKVDNFGNIYITGTTTSTTGFPLVNPLGGAYFDNTYNGPGFSNGDVFISKFNSSMTLIWSTYYGGVKGETGRGITIDAGSNICVTGHTESPDFPKLDPLGGAYFDNSYAGGSGGQGDMFVLKFTNAGVWTWGTYVGGGAGDVGTSIAEDNFGNIFICGQTSIWGGTFPTFNPGGGAYFDNSLNGAADILILKFSNTGAMLWSTYYGGSNDDGFNYSQKIKTNSCGDLLIGGMTKSTNFPTQAASCGGYYDNSHNGGWGDAYILLFNNSGVRLWSTYWGTSGNSVDDFVRAVCFNNNEKLFYATGEFQSAGGPTQDPGGGAFFNAGWSGGTAGAHDPFIAKFMFTPPTYTQSQVNSTACSPCNGSATINLTCSDPNYSFVWSNGSSTLNSTSSTNTITGLCLGTYTVTVTSSCNQTQTTTFTITGTPCGGIAASVNSASMCSGTTPCPTLTAAGAAGTPPYAYLWNTTATTASINPCPSSTTNYTVTITDSGGLSATSTAVVTVNPAITVTTTPTNLTCNGSANGSAIANSGGGTPGYTYNWSNGQTTQTIFGLSQGNYTITITDSKGCTTTSSAVITSPPPLIGLFTKGKSTCAGCGCKEWIMVNASGGISPYSYSWPDGYVNRYKNQLCPGSYSINIKDKNGCSVNINLTAP